MNVLDKAGLNYFSTLIKEFIRTKCMTLTGDQEVYGTKTFRDEPDVNRPVGAQSMLHATATGVGNDNETVRIGMGIGVGGWNRGIYDNYQDHWMINYNQAGELVLDGGATVGSATTPIYLNAGVPTACTGDTTPAGTIAMYAGTSTPSGWLLCNGSTASRTTYANLYSAIGTTWGSGDGSTTFTLPDFRDRFPEGAGSSYSVGTGVSAGAPEVSGSINARQMVTDGGSAISVLMTCSGALASNYEGGGEVNGMMSRSSDSFSNPSDNFLFDASGSNSLYGASSTIQPAARAVYFIIKT